MARTRLLPYKMTSEGAKALSRVLGLTRLYDETRSRFICREDDIIINWGLSVIPAHLQRIASTGFINHPEAVRKACNKLLTYQAFQGVDVPHPEWTQYISEWLTYDGLIYARQNLTGSCGDGIITFNPQAGNTVPRAPLYTKAFNAKREYRVHVCATSVHNTDLAVIDYVKKGKRRGRDSEPSRLIRNHENGWVFIRDGVALPEEVSKAAIKAVNALGLHFGAVDIGWRDGACCVYEVNTAPGFSINSTTVIRYADAIRGLLYSV